ncbi:MAG: hypothetical protein KC592_16560 [Nitrospira sp.]|nr:hypothetical protein [Nitrospira sp.]MCW5783290.1 hypothetical protein [Nitrospirales bacterium]
MAQDIQLQVASAKEQYQQDEPIVIRVMLWNFGEDPQVFNSRLALNNENGPGEISFKIIGPSGQTLPFRARVNIGSPEQEDFAWVLPWNSIGRQYELEPQAEFDLRKKGKYQLVARYTNRQKGEAWSHQAWVGTLTSNPITFEVK